MKFKTIFSRLLLTYMLITIIAIFVLSTLISYTYKSYVFDEKRKSLESVGNRIAAMTLDYYGGKIKIEELNASINSMSYITNSMVYVLKINPKDFNIDDLQLKGLQDAITATDMNKILSGMRIYAQKNYSKDFKTYVLLSGQPLVISGEIQGAVLVFCPENNIMGYIAQMNLKIGVSALLVFLLFTPLIYYNSRKVSKPIKDMDITLKKIAAGESVENNSIRSDDEIGRLSQSFWDMQRQLEKNELIRRDLIANISHELRTPLTSMNGFVHAMLDGVIPKESYDHYLGLIMEENQRLIRLTSDILDLAKIQGGAIQLNLKIVPIRESVFKVIDGINTKAQEKNIGIRVEFDEEFPVVADPERLKQILINIIANSIKYGRENGEIQIFAKEERDFISICIKDNGIGISEEDLPYIFHKFYQAEKSRSGEDESSGLGLNIVKNLVEIQGGNIFVESKLGEGTIVYFSLPKA